MSSDDASVYYRERERASMAMAMALAASEPGIRNIHLELADCYAQLVEDRGDGTARQRAVPEVAPYRPMPDVAGHAMRSAALPTDRLPARHADWSADVSTAQGYPFHIRRAVNADAVAMAAFCSAFDADDVQRLIVDHVRTVQGRHTPPAMEDGDDRMIRYVGLEPETDRIIATSSVLRHPVRATAWAMLIIRPDFEDAGIRWRMLAHISASARSEGVRNFIAIERCSDRRRMKTGHRFGWSASPFGADPRFVVLKKSLCTASKGRSGSRTVVPGPVE